VHFIFELIVKFDGGVGLRDPFSHFISEGGHGEGKFHVSSDWRNVLLRDVDTSLTFFLAVAVFQDVCRHD
jgi:hypothetical protein